MPTRMDWIGAARRLRRKPLYTLSVVLGLAIGIAAVAIIFSWFDGLFLRPLPGVRDSRSLQVFKLRRMDYETTAFSFPDYQDLAEAVASNMDVAAFAMSRITLSGAGKAEQNWALFVSGNFFGTLDIQAATGRLIQPTDTVAIPVVVLSYGWWQSRFHGDPAVVGRTIYLNRQPVQVAGVAPPNFEGPYTGLSFRLYLPLATRDMVEGGSPRLLSRESRSLSLLARLKAGVTPVLASESARVAARRLDQAHPRSAFEQAEITLSPLWKSPAGAQAVVGPVMVALGGVVVMVLLLACINACGVMLIENSLRRREMAIRLSLGAGSGGLMRVCLAESALLAAFGASVGVLAAYLAADHLQDLIPPLPFPVKLTFRIGVPVLAAGVAAAIAASMFCGIWNGLEARRQSGTLRLRRERSRSRGVFIAGQIAVSFVLLYISGAFYSSVQRSRAADLGFDPRSISLARLDLGGGRYTVAQATELLRHTLTRMREAPGVQIASLAQTTPLGVGEQERVEVNPLDDSPTQMTPANRVSPSYFSTLGMRLLWGRDFSDMDRPGSAPVAILNAALAERLWRPGSMGHDLLVAGRRTRIIGIVGNAKLYSLTDEAQPCLYLPLWQSEARSATIHVKSMASLAETHRLVEREIERIDPNLPLSGWTAMPQQIEVAIFPQHIALVVLGIFSAAGMYLAGMGLFGLVAHAAQSRAGEIALRMAIGATPLDVGRMMTRQVGILVVGGLAAGLALSALVSPVLRSAVVVSNGVDWWNAAGAAGVIALAAALAAWLPTLRAMRVQPAAALRGE